MTVRVWNKKDTQAMLYALRDAGYLVKKISGIYKIIDTDTGEPWVMEKGKPLFSAMPGANGYLVNYHPDLMSLEGA